MFMVNAAFNDSKSVVSELLNAKTEPYEILGLTDSGS